MKSFKKEIDLINSEGSILTIGKNTDVNDTHFYIMGKYYTNNYEVPIYTRTNLTIIEMFLYGKITVKEIFLLQRDNYYYLRKNNELVPSSFNLDFKKNIIDNIKCGNSYYYDINSNMQSHLSIPEIIKKLSLLE